MATILLADCVIRKASEGEFMDVLIVTPSTTDADDTLDLADLLQGRTIGDFQFWDPSDEDAGGTVSTISSNVVTMDPAGGTTNTAYRISLRLSL